MRSTDASPLACLNQGLIGAGVYSPHQESTMKNLEQMLRDSVAFCTAKEMETLLRFITGEANRRISVPWRYEDESDTRQTRYVGWIKKPEGIVVIFSSTENAKEIPIKGIFINQQPPDIDYILRYEINSRTAYLCEFDKNAVDIVLLCSKDEGERLA